MTWEQKIQACQAIGDFSLRMRGPGDWYVDQRGVERKEGSLLSGGCVSGAKSPEEAVNQHWSWLTGTMEHGFPIVIDAHRPTHREIFWNGFMWADWNK